MRRKPPPRRLQDSEPLDLHQRLGVPEPRDSDAGHGRVVGADQSFPDRTDVARVVAVVVHVDDVDRQRRQAGGSPDGLAALTVYIVDMDDYRAHARDIGAVWKRLVGTDYPAMAGVGVPRLWDVEALVEIQGFAAL